MGYITSLYGSILGIIFLVLSFRVIFWRIKHKVILGVTESTIELTKRVRAHSNFAEYTPFALLMMYFLEVQWWNHTLLHILWIVFIIGRVLHIFGIDGEKPILLLRQTGMICTFWVYMLLIGSLLYASI